MTLYIVAGIVLVVVVAGWMLFRRARQGGEAVAKVEQLEADRAAADRVKKAGAEARDAGTTQGRLDDRTF